jgi:hypothetical protein
MSQKPNAFQVLMVGEIPVFSERVETFRYNYPSVKACAPPFTAGRKPGALHRFRDHGHQQTDQVDRQDHPAPVEANQ